MGERLEERMNWEEYKEGEGKVHQEAEVPGKGVLLSMEQQSDSKQIETKWDPAWQSDMWLSGSEGRQEGVPGWGLWWDNMQEKGFLGPW